MDGTNNKFSAFVTPTGGGLFAYNAPESQYQQLGAQAAAQQQTGTPGNPGQVSPSSQGASQGQVSPPGSSTTQPPAPTSAPAPTNGASASTPPAGSSVSPPPQGKLVSAQGQQQDQVPQASSPGTEGQAQQPPQQQQQQQQAAEQPEPASQLSGASSPSAGLEMDPSNKETQVALTEARRAADEASNGALQQAQQGAGAPAQGYPMPPKNTSTSLFETLLSDTYTSTPATMGFDTTLATTLGMNNNLGDLRLDALNPNAAQAAYMAQQQHQQQAASSGQQQPPQQGGPGGQQGSAGYPSFQGQPAAPGQFGMPNQGPASLPLLAQQNALLAQQNAALLASNPLLAGHNPYLAQQAMGGMGGMPGGMPGQMPNVWNKWGGWNKWAGGYGHYPPPYKTPGAPIKMTDCDKGPEGCNLFVFHIPNDMTNLDLYQMFSAFGTVISARIMVDKVTGRSRGFGFVSYNNPESAELAIKNMNGFVVGHKRLKVEQKKDKHQLMPPTGTAPFSAAYLAPLQRWAHYHQQAQAHAHVQAQAIHAHAAQGQSQGPPAGAPSAHSAHAHHFYSQGHQNQHQHQAGLFNHQG